MKPGGSPKLDTVSSTGGGGPCVTGAHLPRYPVMLLLDPFLTRWPLAVADYRFVDLDPVTSILIARAPLSASSTIPNTDKVTLVRV